MQGLGELEAAVMDVLWEAGEPQSVRAVLGRLNETRDLAYTTVMTVLTNLHRKGWVDRELHDRAYLYRARRTRDQAISDALRAVLDASGDPESALLHFARGLSTEESDIVRRGFCSQRGRR